MPSISERGDAHMEKQAKDICEQQNSQKQAVTIPQLLAMLGVTVKPAEQSASKAKSKTDVAVC